jgi:hypothetical protein
MDLCCDCSAQYKPLATWMTNCINSPWHQPLGIALTGLGDFPVTSLSETEPFAKFAVTQSTKCKCNEFYFVLRDIQTSRRSELRLVGKDPQP